MQPGVPCGKAILATGDGLGKLGDVNVIEMGADGHRSASRFRLLLEDEIYVRDAHLGWRAVVSVSSVD